MIKVEHVNISGQIVRVPDNGVCADDKFWSGVPLVVGDVVVGLKPNPLLPFGEKSVVAGLSFAVLHYYRDKEKQMVFTLKARTHAYFMRSETGTHSVHGIWPASPSHLHGNNHILMYPGPQTAGNL